MSRDQHQLLLRCLSSVICPLALLHTSQNCELQLFHILPNFVAAPTGAPQNVRASPSSSSSVQVAWTPPQLHLQNGRLSGYRVSCSPSPSGSSSSVSTSSSSSSATVTGLTPYTQYSCKVAAQHQNGTGPYSDSSVVVTAEAGVFCL